jgi:hypothetical protein
MPDAPRTSAPTGVGAEAATGAADSAAGNTPPVDPARAAADLDPRDDRGAEAAAPQGATSASEADDAGGGDVTGGRTGDGLPGLATGTAGGNGIGDSGEGSTSGPVDPEDRGTR